MCLVASAPVILVKVCSNLAVACHVLSMYRFDSEVQALPAFAFFRSPAANSFINIIYIFILFFLITHEIVVSLFFCFYIRKLCHRHCFARFYSCRSLLSIESSQESLQK